ncbi:MAG: metalloregulator ArsR/SmtB family transcription factor [Erysipelotrichaceae bacterium]|jgi:ArsR family transcriptional regulator|nr:metalloregulator ArsR/SmtB family transcription factor [Bacillota bacterium]NLP21404.1 winged helix-turn-helix transcriptional regulator [Erysipelotrichaceae bacterium]HCY06818.1 transcriptional regulator [Erysipelotrichaceae bacterium]
MSEKLYEKVLENMASEEQYDDMSMIFTMFSDSTRLKIMNALFVSELNVSDIANILQMSHSAISHQLSSLKKTKLVKSRKEGKMVYYSLDDDHVKSIFEMAFEHIKE